MIRLNPIYSFFATLWNFVSGKLHFPTEWNETKITLENDAVFEIFRHIHIDNKNNFNQNSAIFIVKFKLKKMSLAKNKKFSKLPIPMFIGLPGFMAKFWCCSEKTGFNLGVYQWETEQDAINYANSFAMKFMTNRSFPNSISSKIIPNTNIYTFIKTLEKK
ncbi:MAG: hypothetical protein HN952_06500 [Candidatus Cloacimonetes bacterium]|jgi:hypothetical protein|nr:hypothetical protein [Candidatus Cloacimonadota bacterium]MBT6994585.1 hypothetical protein [Candidatus Cloacimonadota bacterium]MBT7470126.1 hypothetical protein [Candidatus Cloacimonadota bacterium]